MTLIPQFLSSLQRLKYLVEAGPLSLMTRAALSAAETFPGVEGAAICLTRGAGMRVAVGVSDGEALLAEQLEYTVGSGPGLDADRRCEHVVAGASLSRRWPVLHEALLTGTRYRAIRAVPLTSGAEDPALGVLLLMYGTTSVADHATDGERLDIAQLSLLIGHALSVGGGELAAVLDPPMGSESTPDIRRRLAVEVAIGMVMTTYALSTTDALDVLRGYAYARSQLLDDTAHALVTGGLAIDVFA